MNTISVEVSKANGLSFELLVDGQPIGALLNDGNAGIPYWLAKDGLPTYPYPADDCETDPLVRIVSVCGCGEYGCDHSRCKVTKTSETVEFSDFEGDVGVKGKTIRFEFPLSQYQAVCQQIAKQANELLAADS